MALNKQIWLNTIVENFYPDNSFASKSIDDSTFVNYKTVHIPNAGTPSGVEINRTKKPASVSQRTDNELVYNFGLLCQFLTPHSSFSVYTLHTHLHILS